MINMVNAAKHRTRRREALSRTSPDNRTAFAKAMHAFEMRHALWRISEYAPIS